MAIPFTPILIGSFINAIPVLALYFVVNKNIKRLIPLILFSITYSVGTSVYWISSQVNLTLIITLIVLIVLGLVSLFSILKNGDTRLKSWALASSAIILSSVIPFIRLRLVLDQISPSFYYPLIAVLFAVGVLSLVFSRSVGGPVSSGTTSPNGTSSKAYASRTELNTDLAIKGHSILSDTNLDEVERSRYRQALDEKNND